MKSRKRSSGFHRTTSLCTICICKVENTRRFHQPTQRKTIASTSRKGHRRVVRGLRLIGHYAQSTIVFFRHDRDRGMALLDRVASTRSNYEPRSNSA